MVTRLGVREPLILHMYINMNFDLQVILRADKTTNNFSDRAVLKNLGHWLGMQTLGKNKAILQNVSGSCMYMYNFTINFYNYHMHMYTKDRQLVDNCKNES